MIPLAVIRNGVSQIDEESEEQLEEDQKEKLRMKLMALDNLFQGGRRFILFKRCDSLWNGDSFAERVEELSDRIRKCELLTKVVKSMVSGLK